jgi:putative heme utilization carrier protein HutX
MQTDSTSNTTTEAHLSDLPHAERLRLLRERLQAPFQSTLESLAEKYALSLAEVVACLPEAQRRQMPGSEFVPLLEQLADWGELLLIIHSADGVFECRGPIEKGSVGAGYYNLGHGSPISGHLRYERCREIYCIRRSFHKKETASIQFFNHEGGCMFKIFLGREADGSLRQDQLTRFEALSGLSR